jgi:hypothetical protein
VHAFRTSPFAYTFLLEPLEPRERTRDRLHEPCNFTAVQLSTVCLNLSASSAHFRWELPMHTLITLYLPRDPRLYGSGDRSPVWSVMHCLSSQAPSVHLLYQRQANSCCPVGEEYWKWAGDPMQYHEVWHLLGVQKGANRLELQYRLPSDPAWSSSFSEHQRFDSKRRCWADGTKVEADVLIDVTFFDGRTTRGAIA